MKAKRALQYIDKFESYVCQALLSFFVVILFLQIALRICFDYVLPWSEEISRFSFVWFVFFGAAYAARLAAHNRVTIQFKLFPPLVGNICMFITDIIWIGFNLVMIQKSVEVIIDLMEFPYISPSLGWSMAYVYWIFPISFSLMTIRIIQVNIMKYWLKIEIKDVDKIDPDDIQPLTESR
ncbi:TRAP transporter small permease [Desulfobotulus mexicanus]|uniref:TRAP transporter small permease n=1 Tax=Desulfobotulus mexicanus TaxID=2586642 RepID=A0A5Q4VF85_9BACT|nr:TRAP transporter small permease [Desulfobotulus mexicanus]TYT74701.1 TRAP transporter small permease [Desulfobotulus mexicanus]